MIKIHLQKRSEENNWSKLISKTTEKEKDYPNDSPKRRRRKSMIKMELQKRGNENKSSKLISKTAAEKMNHQ